MRVLVTGSRNFSDPAIVREALGGLYMRRFSAGDHSLFMVVHGGAHGADRMAKLWVRDAKTVGWSVDEEEHKADWEGAYRLTAGFRRNQEMVGSDIDWVLGFLAPCIKATCPGKGEHPSHGVVDCVHAAVDAALDIQTFRDPTWRLG